MSAERISRALELARAQREARALSVSQPTATAGMVDVGAASVSAERAEVELGDTLVFELPKVQLDPARRERERILPPNCGSEFGGAYKMLRTQVLKRLDQLGANTLAVVSAAAGAGKTLTAINLAVAIAAESGRTALLVDFDLRNPSIHSRFGYRPSVGIEDCIAGKRPVHEAMIKVGGYDRLTIVPARARTDNSSELLSSQRAVDVMREMRTRYANRILIFDLPPVLQADDALVFSRIVQSALVVVGEGRTRREDVTRTIELLRDLPIVGTVLNGSKERTQMHY